MKVIYKDERVRQGKAFERCYHVSRLRKELENRNTLKVLRKEGQFGCTLPRRRLEGI